MFGFDKFIQKPYFSEKKEVKKEINVYFNRESLKPKQKNIICRGAYT